MKSCYVERHQFGAGRGRRERDSDGPADAESDSDDGLFQKLEPEAARSRRRRLHDPSPSSTSPRHREEDEENQLENLSHGDILARQEERRIPDSKLSKKRRKKNKLAADDVGQEQDGNRESEVRAEKDSLFSLTCSLANGGEEEKKTKKKRKRVGDEQLQPSVLQPLDDAAETQRKKEKLVDRAEPPATQTGDELELNEENGMENLSRDDIPARQEERRIPDSKLSKKRRKKNKLAADDVGQEQDGNGETEVREEKDSLFSLTCSVENGGEEEKKKKNRKRVGDEQLQSSVLQPLNDAAETQRKKEKLPAARSVHSEAEETPGPTEDDRAEPPATQTGDELELNEENGIFITQFGAGRGRRERDSDGPADAESDSDDGLFITQKLEPEAARLRWRRLHDPSPSSTSPRHREEDEAGPPLPSSLGESKSVKARRIRNLPKYSLSFVTKTRPRAAWVSARQSKNLHHYAIGGFFKCVGELWQGRRRGDDPQAPLPTVDVDGENISPLTDDEDAWSESEDIKVVERTRFVARLKAKSSQPRHITEKGGSSVKRQKRSAGEGREVSRRTPTQIQNKTPVKASTAFPLDNHNVDPPRRDLTEETSDKHFTSDGSILVHTESPGTNTRLTRVSKILFHRKEREEELCDESDATYCDPSELQGGSPWEHTEKDREASPNVTEPQAGVFTTDNLSQAEDEPESQSLLRCLPECVTDGNNERVCNVTRANGDHERGDQSREEPEGLPAARSLCVEAEETPGPTEDDRAEPPATQTGDELELNKENWMENLSHCDIPTRQEERRIPDSKLEKKRRKKNKSAADDVGQEQDGNRESEVRAEKDSLFSLTCSVENGGEEEEKKKKRKRVGDEQLQSSVLEPCNDAETQRKKENKLVNMEERGEEETLNMALHLPLISKEQLEETGHSLENTEKKKKKKRKMIVGGDGDIEQLQSSAVSEPPIDDAETRREKKRQKKEKTLVNTEEQGEEDALNMTSERSVKKKKKKKKKKKRRESISEGVDVSCTPDKNKKADDVEHSQKTKEGPDGRDTESVTKKKKKSEMFSRDVSEDAVAQSADSRSVRKKEKRRTPSFLAADAEEKAAQTQGEVEQSFSTFQLSKSVVVSAVADESAETAGNVEESDDGVRKKKRKRKKSEAQKDHERDFEEANETCRGVLPEAADAGKKRKKKPRGNESEPVSAAGRSERADDAGHCQTDEAAAFKKKKKNKVAPHNATQGRTDDVESEGDPSTCSSVSLSRKEKQLACPSALQKSPDRRAAVSHDQRTSDKSSKEARNKLHLAPPTSQTPVNPVVNGVRDKKEKKKEHKQKRQLHNLSEDFLTND